MKLELERNSSIPFYLQIEEQLREQIASGAIAPLSPVPSENEMAELFGVSRMTARKAVDRLVSDGFLYRRQGKGTFVAAPRISHPPTTEASFSAAIDELGLPHSTRVLRASLERPVAHVERELRVTPGDLVVHISRLRFIDGEPAAIHTTYLPPQFARILDHDLTGSLTKALAEEGIRTSITRDSFEAVTASADDAVLLGIPVHAPIMRFESVGLSASNEPVRYTESQYRGDRFRFTAEWRTGSEPRLIVKDA